MRRACGRREKRIGLMEKPERKIPFGIPRHRQKVNVERSERNRLDVQRQENHIFLCTW
jgi:hypothetical protein